MTKEKKTFIIKQLMRIAKHAKACDAKLSGPKS